MQSSLASSVTPRPVKAGAAAPGKPLGSPLASRAGRTYSPSASPIKTQHTAPPNGSNPFSFGDAAVSPGKHGLIRAPESTTPTTLNGSPLRKKSIILSGDIRNLDSNFELAMSNVRVTLAHVISALGRYGIAVSNDDAKTLLYEYEENNDTNLGYDAFVDDLVQMLRQTALNKTGTTPTQIKKIRLTHHLDKLSTHQTHIAHELQTLLGDKLRVSWTTVRDTFRAADLARDLRRARDELPAQDRARDLGRVAARARQVPRCTAAKELRGAVSRLRLAREPAHELPHTREELPSRGDGRCRVFPAGRALEHRENVRQIANRVACDGLERPCAACAAHGDSVARTQGADLGRRCPSPGPHPRVRVQGDRVATSRALGRPGRVLVLIRYGSSLTDYEDPGLETADAASSSPTKRDNPPRIERKDRVRQPGSNSLGPNGHGLVVAFTDADKMEREQEEKRLRAFFVVNLRALEALLAQEDVDKKGFVTVECITKFCKELNGGRWKETDASVAFFSKYVAQNQLFYYRGFLLDVDQKAGLQTQVLVLQDDDDGNGLEAQDRYNDPNDDNLGQILDVHRAKDALRYHLTSTRSKQKATYKLFQRLDPGKSGLLTYPELRRVLERLDIVVDDATVREWLSQQFEEEDDAGDKTGRVKCLQVLHAHGGRDPDKVDAMSDLSSNCSYYSAISISPRPAVRSSHGGGASSPRTIGNRDYVAAAQAVTNVIEKPRNGFAPLAGAVAAAAVERKIKAQLDASGTKNKWKQLARAFQQIDSGHSRRGSVLAGSFQKVMHEFGVHLDQEEIVRLQLKYDIEQNGRIHYHEYLRHLTNAMSDLSSGGDSAGELLPSLGPHSPRAHATKAANGVSTNSSNNSTGGISDSLRQGVKAKWKAIYSSFKTLDKQNIGRVSTAYFRQLLEWYALPVNDDAFLAILRQFDHDDDGFVDYNKFMRTCCR
ncbi:hypothetical protein FI667_g9181, partial [Globisporangium splendens]